MPSDVKNAEAGRYPVRIPIKARVFVAFLKIKCFLKQMTMEAVYKCKNILALQSAARRQIRQTLKSHLLGVPEQRQKQ